MIEDMLEDLGFEERDGLFERGWDDSSILVRILGDSVRLTWVDEHHGREVLEEVSLEMPEFDTEATEELERLAVAADYFDEHGRKPPHGRKLQGLGEVSGSCDLGAHERCSGCECGCHEVIKRCGCGRTYTQEQWGELKPLGTQVTEEAGVRYFTVMANCVCGSTIATERQEPM